MRNPNEAALGREESHWKMKKWCRTNRQYDPVALLLLADCRLPSLLVVGAEEDEEALVPVCSWQCANTSTLDVTASIGD